MVNQWRKMDDNYWMCFRYDVWHTNGVWYASFYVGSRFQPSFKTAQAAMRYCDVRPNA